VLEKSAPTERRRGHCARGGWGCNSALAVNVVSGAVGFEFADVSLNLGGRLGGPVWGNGLVTNNGNVLIGPGAGFHGDATFAAGVLPLPGVSGRSRGPTGRRAWA
jgi:hypothetical protein